MEKIHVFVGLDYHTKGVQVCVLNADGKVLLNRRCSNSVAEIGGVIDSSWEVRRVVMESCCGAADLAEALIADLRWPVDLAHAGYVARMKHNPDKTDVADARMLADLARAGLVPQVWLAPHKVRELRVLIRLRADLAAQAKAAKLRILALLRQQRIAEPSRPEAPGRWSQKWLAWLDDCALSEQGRFAAQMYLEQLEMLRARIQQVEARLHEATKGDAMVERLLTLNGVGKVTAWTLRALIGRFDRFTSGKQLARFCAVTPRNSSSGERMADSGMIRAGDPQLKGIVVEAAHRLKRYEPRWEKLAESMRERGKPGSVIVGAVANRWLRWLYHQMKEVSQAA